MKSKLKRFNFLPGCITLIAYWNNEISFGFQFILDIKLTEAWSFVFQQYVLALMIPDVERILVHCFK